MTQKFLFYFQKSIPLAIRARKLRKEKQYFQRPASGRRKRTRGPRAYGGACTFAQPIISRKQMSEHREAVAAHCRVIARNQHLFAYTVTLAAKLVNMPAIQCQHWTYVL